MVSTTAFSLSGPEESVLHKAIKAGDGLLREAVGQRSRSEHALQVGLVDVAIQGSLDGHGILALGATAADAEQRVHENEGNHGHQHHAGHEQTLVLTEKRKRAGHGNILAEVQAPAANKP